MILKYSHRLTIVFLLQGINCYAQEYKTGTLIDSASVLAAIKKGAVGDCAAISANKDPNIQISKIKDPGVPFEFYVVLDYQGQYTVMVEKDKLIMLCSGFGGGAAHSFSISKVNGELLLRFVFETGSGVTTTHDGSYVLGSGKVTTKERPWSP